MSVCCSSHLGSEVQKPEACSWARTRGQRREEDVTAILAFSLVAHLEMNLALLGGSDAVW